MSYRVAARESYYFISIAAVYSRTRKWLFEVFFKKNELMIKVVILANSL